MHKRYLPKISFLFLMLLILLPVFPARAASDPSIGSEISHGYWIHPFCRNQGFQPEAQITSDEEVLLGASETADRKDYSIDRCGETVRAFFKKRTASFTVYLVMDTDPSSDGAQYGRDVFDAAIQHTGVPAEGDYLENSLMYCSWTAYSTYKNSCYLLTLEYSPVYVCGYAKEEAVSARFLSLYSELELADKTDYQKARIVFDYLSRNIRYDYDALASVNNRIGHSAYNALFKQTCVCQGFSLCFYRLMLMAGVDCRIIRSSNHSWNLVNMHGIYYNVDATWASIALEENKDPYIYFLTSNAIMNSYGNHVRVWPFTEASFKALYPTGSGIYEPNAADTGEAEVTARPLVLTSLKKSDNNHLTLQWEAYPSALGYKIFRKMRAQDEWKELTEVSADLLAYTDLTTEVGETYYYTVKAILADESCSLFDNIGLHLRCGFTAELALRSAKAVSDHSVVLTWNKADGANGYCIYVKTADSDTWILKTVTGDVDTYTVDALQADCTYAFTIAPAKKYAGFTIRGSYSDPGLQASTFAVPSLTAVAKGNGKVTISWTSCPGISGYQCCITQEDTGSKKYIKYSGTQNKVNLTLIPGKTYTFRIRTRKKSNGTNYYGSWSEKISAVIR